jgi:predicted hotdog family 3-hydroxylacyl-ACP dehydratase
LIDEQRARDRDWIASHIPHQGSMCLLDQVVSWDSQGIVCSSGTHRDPDNPLRAHGRLGAACAIEYAAQAIAVHGALLQPPEPGAGSIGLLASAREVELLVSRLDDLSTDLQINAQRLHSDARGALYSFALHADQQLLARGRASILISADPPGQAAGASP